MSGQGHQHQQPQQKAPLPFGGRQPSPGTIIAKLNAKLNDQASLVRGLEDLIVWRESLIEDLLTEIGGYTAAIDQVVAENHLLRRRLGLSEAGVIEPTEAEAAEAAAVEPPAAAVVEAQPDAG